MLLSSYILHNIIILHLVYSYCLRWSIQLLYCIWNAATFLSSLLSRAWYTFIILNLIDRFIMWLAYSYLLVFGIQLLSCVLFSVTILWLVYSYYLVLSIHLLCCIWYTVLCCAWYKVPYLVLDIQLLSCVWYTYIQLLSSMYF